MRHYEKIPVSDIFAITETDHSAKLNLEEFQVRYNYFKSLRTPPLDQKARRKPLALDMGISRRRL